MVEGRGGGDGDEVEGAEAVGEGGVGEDGGGKVEAEGREV